MRRRRPALRQQQRQQQQQQGAADLARAAISQLPSRTASAWEV
jgi:hypothetical protein